MRFDIVTLFPNMFDSYFGESILKIAQEKEKIEIHFHNPRDFTNSKHLKVDDTPYGGGPGMVLQVQPFYNCITSIPRLERSRVLMMDPGGTEYTQPMAHTLGEELDQIIIVCGRYEGFDERIYNLVDERISIGKYVLAGGEIPAMILVETVARLLPGVLGDIESTKDETFAEGMDYVEHPQYTKPATFITNDGEEWNVPDVLLSGDHAKIAEWRKANSKE